MSERRRPVDRPRRAALDVLTAVRVDQAYANLVLPQVLRKHGLEGRDAALATELASGAIRMQGLYDAVIDASLTKPKLQAGVRDVLRLGAHQLLSMRVPDHAAISTSVDLVRASVGQGPPAWSTPCSGRSAGAASPSGSRTSHPTGPRTSTATSRWHSPTRAGWSTRWARRWATTPSSRPCSPPTTRPRG